MKIINQAYQIPSEKSIKVAQEYALKVEVEDIDILILMKLEGLSCNTIYETIQSYTQH